MRKLVLIVLCVMYTVLLISANWVFAETTVRMWTFLNPDMENPTGRNLALKKIITDFEKSHPGVNIEVEPQQWDIMTTKFLTAHMSNTAPDIMWVIQDQLGEALSLGALEPFENLFLDQYSVEDIEDFNDAFWKFGVTDGKHYQFSLSRNYTCIMYRKDLFREKGIAEHFDNLNQLVQAAQAFTEHDEKLGIQRYGLGMGLAKDKVDINIAMAQLLAKQGDLYTEDGKANWSTPAGVESFQFLADLINKYEVTPKESVNLTGEDVFTEFYAGKYAMIFAGSVRVPKVRGSITVCKPEDVSIMLIPSEKDNVPAPSVAGGWSVAVWSKSKVKKEAGAFMEALFSPEADKLWGLDGGQIPARQSTIAALPDFFADPANEYLKIIAQGLREAAYTVPTKFSTNGYRADFNIIVQDIILNDTPIEKAIQKVERTFNDRNEMY